MSQFVRSLTFVLSLGLPLACASAEAPAQEAPAATESSGERPSFDELPPHVGEPAPAISLLTLTGNRVSLPGSAADRAAVLIFGSFS